MPSPTQTSYNTVAANYADLTRDALSHHPYLRTALAHLAEELRDADAPVADVGCGPGHVTAHLKALGVNTFGLDLAPGMIDVARREHPDLAFLVGAMPTLPLATGSVAGVLSWWTLIHLPDDVIPLALKDFHRVLRPGAPLQLGFHTGDDVRLKTSGYGDLPMEVQVHRRPLTRVSGWLCDAGFTVEAEIQLNGDSPSGMLFARRQS